MNTYHIPVLLQPAIDFLNVAPGLWYADCTIGAGGHSEEILKRGGNVFGIDQDKAVLAKASQRLQAQFDKKRYILVHTNFTQLEQVLKQYQIGVAGIIFDLGVSSLQLDSKDRGFSFQKNADLDMRMDPDNQKVTARDLVNGLHNKELEKLLTTYGEEPLSATIAQSIVRSRQKKSLATTQELAELVREVYKKKFRNKSRLHPATKTFQALRIAVNDELNALKKILNDGIKILKPKGRIVVISFHSLEDKIVKHTFTNWNEQGWAKIITKKPLIPIQREISENPRSRSAKLRVAEKSQR